MNCRTQCSLHGRRGKAQILLCCPVQIHHFCALCSTYSMNNNRKFSYIWTTNLILAYMLRGSVSESCSFSVTQVSAVPANRNVGSQYIWLSEKCLGLEVCNSTAKYQEGRLLFLCFSETTKSRRCSTAAIAKNIAHIPNITLIGNALTCSKHKNEYIRCYVQNNHWRYYKAAQIKKTLVKTILPLKWINTEDQRM